jgi:hypothetical protein
MLQDGVALANWGVSHLGLSNQLQSLAFILSNTAQTPEPYITDAETVDGRVMRFTRIADPTSASDHMYLGDAGSIIMIRRPPISRRKHNYPRRQPMRMEIRKTVLTRVYLTLSGLSVLALAAMGIQTPDVPGNLKVPEGQMVLLKAVGQGVQIYACGAKASDPTHFEWVFKAPEADLVDDKGEKIGKHYAGPTWEANDSSKVVGEVLERADAPRTRTVPWLLLKAKSNQGDGRFKSVTYIQRVNTEGGAAPRDGCDAQHGGAEARVDYKAIYYFYAQKSTRRIESC